MFAKVLDKPLLQYINIVLKALTWNMQLLNVLCRESNEKRGLQSNLLTSIPPSLVTIANNSVVFFNSCLV